MYTIIFRQDADSLKMHSDATFDLVTIQYGANKEVGYTANLLAMLV